MMLGDREYDYINGCWVLEESPKSTVSWDEDWDEDWEQERYREFQEANYINYFEP